MAEDTRSLWEQFDSEIEPWRRGRFALIVIGFCYFAFQVLIVASQIAVGSIEQVFAFGTGCAIFWLQFYFIWIGVHWIRWLAGVWAGLLGFCLIIWGVRDSNAITASFGAGNLFICSYFCLSSSVYFFARRQGERRDWWHSIAVAVVFGLLVIMFFGVSIALSAYKNRLEQEAREFADDAFTKIFVSHDPEFFLTHITEPTLAAVGGRDRVTRFVQRTRFNPGEIDEPGPVTGQLRVSYGFPASLTSIGNMTITGGTIYGRISIHMEIIDTGKGWQINALWWNH